MPANPYKVLYFNPSLPVVKFSKMAARYHNDRELHMMHKAARLAGYVLVPSSGLHWYQRKKHQNSSFRIGKHVYYFLPQKIVRGIKNMVRKICPECKKSSYSSAVEGEWICPYCGTDMTLEPAKSIINDGGDNNENRISKGKA